MIVRYVVDKLPILRYQLPINVELHIVDDISLELHENKQTSAGDSESGGILLGSIYDDIVRVEAISTPSGSDVRGINYFQRDKAQAQRLINQAYEYSHGTTNYLGEWHTHYQEYPQPSQLDSSEIQKTFKNSILPLNYIIDIIVGCGDNIGDLWIGFIAERGIESCPRIIDR